MPSPRPALDDLLRNQEPARLIPSYSLKLKDEGGVGRDGVGGLPSSQVNSLSDLAG
ncbi:MAG: hypothetical protein OXU63_16760 [Acidobacteriota bacterium]|nr:hypothetical protein [Acidobacteriota bacterium]